MSNFKAEAIKLRLNELFNKSSHFSICDINDIAKSIGSNPKSHPDYNDLSLIHCVHYRDMSREMIEEIKLKCMNVLSSRFDTETMARALVAVANGEIKDQPQIEDTYIDNVRRLK